MTNVLNAICNIFDKKSYSKSYTVPLLARYRKGRIMIIPVTRQMQLNELIVVDIVTLDDQNICDKDRWKFDKC